MVKDKAADFFDPFQRGVACAAGAEKIAHGLRDCVEENWHVEGFTVLKIDLVNAFNLVSRQVLLSECGTHFPELLPWVSWCYCQHPVLWHTLGNLTSQSLLFSLVLNVVIQVILNAVICATMRGTLMTVFWLAQIHPLGKHLPYSWSLVPPLAFV